MRQMWRENPQAEKVMREMQEKMTITPLGTSRIIKRALLLKTGQTTSYGSGSGVDDGALQVGVAKSYTVLTAGQYSGSTNITVNSKTDAHGNACVIDNNTGLMWSRKVSASVGPTSTGALPWTTTGSGGTAEGIFPYVAAANSAALAGHSDWRIPNDLELQTLRDMEAATANPDSTAFPTGWTGTVWSSTTQPSNTANAMATLYGSGGNSSTAKTTANFCALVRGPI